MTYSPTLRTSILASFSLIATGAMFPQAPTNTQFITGKAIRISGSEYSAPEFSNIFSVADLNKDGRPDIVATYTPPGAIPKLSYAVLLANSDGSYTPKLTGINVQYNLAGPYVDLDTLQVADVDGDGVPDLVIVTSSPFEDEFYNNQDNYVEVGNSTFTVYHGNGDGTFRSTGSVLIGVDISANLPRIVDLKTDGKPDLLINTYYVENPAQNGTFTVWKNLDHDVFEAGNFFIGYYLGQDFAVGDVNGDGYPDLVLPGIGGGTQILLNNKKEGFTTGASYPFNPEYLAIGDLNHDGKPDLAMVTSQLFGPYEGLLGQTLLGKGDGTLVTGSIFQVPLIPTTSNLVSATGPLTIQDANGDGKPDIVFAAGDEGDSGSFLQIFAGDGKGGVQPPSTYSVSGYYFGDTSIAPISGKPGLFYSALAGISQATSDGKGNFNLPREDTGVTPDSIAQGDVNGDGISDVVVMSYGGTNPNPCQATVLAYPGTGKGYFGAALHYYVDMLQGSVAVGDVNGDGKPDIVVARQRAYSVNSCPYKADLVVLLGNGDGSFQAPVDYKVLGQVGDGQNSSTYAFLADENGDGKLDLIGDWGVALGKGNGEFEKPIPLPTFFGDYNTLALADFNGDGFMDLAVGSNDNISGVTGLSLVHILLADGTGHFTVKSQNSLPNTFVGGGFAVGDMNGDGKPDLVFTSITNLGYFITVRLGNGDGTTKAPINYQLATPSTDIQPQPPLLLADLNQDGKLDLIALGALPLSGKTATGNLTVFYGLGDGHLSATPEYYPLSFGGATVLDLNGDHAPDILGFTQDTLVRVLNTGNKGKVTK